MLADEIIANKELNLLGKGHLELIKDLRKAHRFDLDAAFTAASDTLGISRPSAFENALDLCRLPYPLTWFETANSHRRRFSISSGPNRPPIHRIGCLLSSGINQTGWIAHLAWSFPSGEVNLCSLALGFDYSGERPFKNLWTGLDPEKQAARMRSVQDPWANSPTEVAATIRFAERTAPMPSLYHLRALDGRPQAEIIAAGQHFVSVGQADWESEQPFWLGALALLNSRNASGIIAGPNIAKLNKSRRRQGKEDLLDFSTCTISPRLQARYSSDLEENTRLDGIRAHFVRGHFKIRSSGVFWWSPFLRGDSQKGFVAKDYRVVGGDPARAG